VRREAVSQSQWTIAVVAQSGCHIKTAQPTNNEARPLQGLSFLARFNDDI